MDLYSLLYKHFGSQLEILLLFKVSTIFAAIRFIVEVEEQIISLIQVFSKIADKQKSFK